MLHRQFLLDAISAPIIRYDSFISAISCGIPVRETVNDIVAAMELDYFILTCNDEKTKNKLFVSGCAYL